MPLAPILRLDTTRYEGITLPLFLYPIQNKAILFRCFLASTVILSVLAALFPRFPGDHSIAKLVQALAIGQAEAAFLDNAMKSVSIIGSFPVVITTVITVGAIFCFFRRWREGFLVWMVLIAEGIVKGIKAVIDRPRPTEEFVRILEHSSSGSFPSGHAFHGILFLGLLIILSAGIKTTGLKIGVRSIFITVMLLLGLSRVYLGTHWPSDVLGSFLWAITALYIFESFYQKIRGRDNGL
jgi:membrane-associated phospholipid phosphatase